MPLRLRRDSDRMLYQFDRETRSLDKLEMVSAASADVAEKDIELALAHAPASLFQSSVAEGPPALIVKKSQPGQAMADIVALDAEGRLILVECKRGWAHRDALAQLLDYASDYTGRPYDRLDRDWATGEGARKDGTLIEHFRSFSEDAQVAEDDLGTKHVLVVVAAGRDHAFEKIAKYLEQRGVAVYFVTARIFRRSADGQLFLDVEPIALDPGAATETAAEGRAWMVNTGATWVQGADELFVERGVAAIWDYPDGPKTLDQGAQAGDPVYAYQNGRGIIAAGRVVDGQVYQAKKEESVFPGTSGENEWHLKVEWTVVDPPISNSTVREAAGAGLPVRNTFCRLWNAAVRKELAKRTGNA